MDRVLCVDDDPELLSMTASFLRRDEAFAVEPVDSAAEGLAVLDSDRPVDAVVSDYEMPGMDGLEFLRAVRADHDDLPFILFTSEGSESVASDAISAGVTDYLQKGGPEQYELLRNRLSNTIEQYTARQQLERERAMRERILEASPIGIVGHDADGAVVFHNERALEILAARPDELDGGIYDEAGWILRRDGEPIETSDLPYRRVIDDGESIAGHRYSVELADGGERDVRVYGAPLREDDAIVGAVIAFSVDE